jgi:hypothetical protein
VTYLAETIGHFVYLGGPLAKDSSTGLKSLVVPYRQLAVI